jgi:hypothetical protein
MVMGAIRGRRVIACAAHCSKTFRLKKLPNGIVLIFGG